jgi:HNH endonuclease
MHVNPSEDYSREVEVCFDGEVYLARDNGAVLRRSRPGGRRRKLDDVWTFGTKDPTHGYMMIGQHRVHRVIASAFHEQPTSQHIVDHIDTNRANNRAENLRWLTRLENVLNNPVTLKRVLIAYGSLDAFFADPSAVRTHVQEIGWMRTVSKEEAAESRKRLQRWAETPAVPNGGRLGEWVFRSGGDQQSPAAEDIDVASLTAMAIQRGWKTATEFPGCPTAVSERALADYEASFAPGTVFSRNTFGEARAEIVGHTDSVLGIVTRLGAASVKEWAVAKVTVENGRFVHESVGTYFTREGALNAFNGLLGIDAAHIETIDDYA